MEEHQEFKHACKFCSKSFPCGRSLGGHMRSHIANVSAETTEEKLATRKLKLSSLNNNGGSGSYAKGVVDMGSEAGTNNTNNTGYVLRENRKKTWRLADLSEDTLVSDKFCKECGKGFHSWKALFGHMKCHSEKERVSNSLDDQDSWTNNNATQQKQLVMDSQSDNEATVPNRRRRSKRRTRYMTAAAAAAAATSSSLSEVEQEQEEVAVSLMMLSRDVGPWSGLNSVAESSDNNSPYLEARSSVGTKIEGKKPIPNGSDSEIAVAAKLIKQSDKKREFGNMVSSNLNLKGKSSELLVSEFPGKGFKNNKTSVFIKNEKAEKSELDYVSALKNSEGGQLKKKKKKNGVNGTELVLSKPATNKYTSIKTKFFDSELKSNSLKNCWVNKPAEAEFSKNTHKRGKFECATCNKAFHSYQALGGHRASHKKIKGNYFASRNDQSSENSIETDLSPDPTTESKHMKNNGNEYVVGAEHELDVGFDNEADTVTESKKSKEHECPICLKVFPSGQALGGHKRSHLGGGCESRNSQTIVLQEPVPEIRNFLDLNLPAVTEEESNSHADSYTPWWVVEGNHKQEALVGLMSN